MEMTKDQLTVKDYADFKADFESMEQQYWDDRWDASYWKPLAGLSMREHGLSPSILSTFLTALREDYAGFSEACGAFAWSSHLISSFAYEVTEEGRAVEKQSVAFLDRVRDTGSLRSPKDVVRVWIALRAYIEYPKLQQLVAEGIDW